LRNTFFVIKIFVLIFPTLHPSRFFLHFGSSWIWWIIIICFSVFKVGPTLKNIDNNRNLDLHLTWTAKSKGIGIFAFFLFLLCGFAFEINFEKGTWHFTFYNAKQEKNGIIPWCPTANICKLHRTKANQTIRMCSNIFQLNLIKYRKND